jgi:NADPH:quinone reductase-like Zn-dependent oxidoreductase
MKAVVFHGIGDIRLDDVKEPKIQDDTDVIVRITASAICGTDLHFIRGTMPGVKPGRILGHEAVGVVEEVGKGVRNLRAGDRVVVPQRLDAATARIAAPATSRSATTPVRRGSAAVPSSLAARRTLAVSTDYKPSTRAFHLEMSDSSSFRIKSPTIRRS